MIARPNERGGVAAVLGYAGTVLGTLLLFPSHPEFAATVLAVIAFGDSAAEVFGVYIGRRTLPWNRAKTWAGLAGFLLCATPLATAAYWWAADPTVPLLYAAVRGASATLAGALAESLPSPIGPCRERTPCRSANHDGPVWRGLRNATASAKWGHSTY